MLERLYLSTFIEINSERQREFEALNVDEDLSTTWYLMKRAATNGW